MTQRPGQWPMRKPEPKPPRFPNRHWGDDSDDDEDDHGHKKSKHKPRSKNMHLDPHHVPSSYHCDQMMPFGNEFGRIFPRFHPCWLQRVHTPVPRVSAYPLHYRGYHPGGFGPGAGHRGHMWGR